MSAAWPEATSGAVLLTRWFAAANDEQAHRLSDEWLGRREVLALTAVSEMGGELQRVARGYARLADDGAVSGPADNPDERPAAAPPPTSVTSTSHSEGGRGKILPGHQRQDDAEHS